MTGRTAMFIVLVLLVSPLAFAFDAYTKSYTIEKYHHGSAGDNASTVSFYGFRSTTTYEQGSGHLETKTLEGNSGLIISRGNPEQIKKQLTIYENLDIAFLTKKPIIGMINLSDLNEVLHKINVFTQKKKNPVILLDGIHYLLSHYSFDSFINLLYDITDIIVDHRAMLFVRIDPATLNQQQMALIENELLNLPGQKTEDLIITDDLFNLISYIYRQNQNNTLVSVKKVMNEFNITYVTAASRIDALEEKKLIYSKKQGKIRAIFVSNQGKKLIHKRKIA